MAAPTSGRKVTVTVGATSTFKEAAEAWLVAAQCRKRKPMRNTSVPSVQGALDKWLFPNIGSLPLAQVHNGSVKRLVSVMSVGGLSPKSINTYTNLVKSIMKSVV